MARRTRKQSRLAGLNRRRRRGIIAILVATLGIVVALGGFGWLALSKLMSPFKPGSTEHVLVAIPRGATPRMVARILAKDEVVRSPSAFLVALRLVGGAGRIRADKYDLSPGMTPKQIVLGIETGSATATSWVTIPEGFTARQIAERLGERKLADPTAFMAAVRTGGGLQRFPDGFLPPSRNLEGYLFPDTYRITEGTTIPAILTQMVGEFDEKVVRANPRVTDWRKVVILASLVEREAKVEKDRPLIASVMFNRLKTGMPLDIDASIEYALPEHKARLMFSDLRTPSPYNTYLHRGLPPGPICSPGVASIEAVLHPAKTSYLYYVAGPAGASIFSHTLAQQDQVIARLRGKTLQ